MRAVPAGIVEDQNDDALVPGAGLAREGVEQLGKERLSMPFEMYQALSPVAGATKAVT